MLLHVHMFVKHPRSCLIDRARSILIIIHIQTHIDLLPARNWIDWQRFCIFPYHKLSMLDWCPKNVDYEAFKCDSAHIEAIAQQRTLQPVWGSVCLEIQHLALCLTFQVWPDLPDTWPTGWVVWPQVGQPSRVSLLPGHGGTGDGIHGLFLVSSNIYSWTMLLSCRSQNFHFYIQSVVLPGTGQIQFRGNFGIFHLKNNYPEEYLFVSAL